MKTLLLVLVLGNAADTTSSLAVFHAGGRETNPLVISQRPVPFVIQAAVFTTAEVWALRQLSASHPKWARALASIQIGVSTGLVVNNAVAYHRQLRNNRAALPSAPPVPAQWRIGTDITW